MKMKGGGGAGKGPRGPTLGWLSSKQKVFLLEARTPQLGTNRCAPGPRRATLCLRLMRASKTWGSQQTSLRHNGHVQGVVPTGIPSAANLTVVCSFGVPFGGLCSFGGLVSFGALRQGPWGLVSFFGVGFFFFYHRVVSFRVWGFVWGFVLV